MTGLADTLADGKPDFLGGRSSACPGRPGFERTALAGPDKPDLVPVDHGVRAIAQLELGQDPGVGSSTISNRGRPSIAAAIPSRWRMPWE